MRLSEFIERHEASARAYARRHGCEPTSVSRWAAAPGSDRAQIPRPDDMARIHSLSDGRVEPADFYDLPSVAGARRRAIVTVYALAAALAAREPGAPLALFALRASLSSLTGYSPGALRALQMGLSDALARALAEVQPTAKAGEAAKTGEAA